MRGGIGLTKSGTKRDRGTHQDRNADHLLEEEYEEVPSVSIKQSKPMLARLSVTSPKT